AAERAASSSWGMRASALSNGTARRPPADSLRLITGASAPSPSSAAFRGLRAAVFLVAAFFFLAAGVFFVAMSMGCGVRRCTPNGLVSRINIIVAQPVPAHPGKDGHPSPAGTPWQAL